MQRRIVQREPILSGELHSGFVTQQRVVQHEPILNGELQNRPVIQRRVAQHEPILDGEPRSVLLILRRVGRLGWMKLGGSRSSMCHRRHAWNRCYWIDSESLCGLIICTPAGWWSYRII